MEKPLIAIDIDDVLSRSAEGFAAFSNQRWNSNMTAGDYTEAWAVAWGIPLEEAVQRSIEFHDLAAHSTYRPIAEALPVLQKLSRRYRLVAMTSRREVVKALTDSWMARHFPGVFGTVYYAGMWDKQSHVHDKLQATNLSIAWQLPSRGWKLCYLAATIGTRA
jgi:5'(3')-deoxyribonucleotidase